MIKKDLLILISILSSEGTEDAITWAWAVYKSDNSKTLLSTKAKTIYKDLLKDLEGETSAQNKDWS